MPLKYKVFAFIMALVLLTPSLVAPKAALAQGAVSCHPGPGGTYVCTPVVSQSAPPTNTTTTSTNTTTTTTNGGYGTITANPGEGAFALANRCGVSLDVFMSANGMSGPNPIISAYGTYNCGGGNGSVPTYNTPTTVQPRSVADGHGFTITTEQTWSDAAFKCANARTGASQMIEVNVFVNYLKAGDWVTCPLYNDSNDGTVYVPTTTPAATSNIPANTKLGWWATTTYGAEYVEVTTITNFAVGTSVAYSAAYSYSAVASVTVGGVVVGYLVPVAAGTGFVIWAMANARTAVNNDIVIAAANANSNAQDHNMANQNTGSPMPPNCDSAWYSLWATFEGVTDTHAVIARSQLTGGAASAFTAALSLLQSSLCADHFNISSDSTHWYISKK